VDVRLHVPTVAFLLEATYLRGFFASIQDLSFDENICLVIQQYYLKKEMVVERKEATQMRRRK
jgi:hypothetical protein